ncbi:MAG: RHS repeat domain-containing protein, partial [Bacteroidia bacterium]
ASIDYISLQAKQITDANNNIHQAIFDPLGQVIVSSSYSVKSGVRSGGMSLYPESASVPAEYIPRSPNPLTLLDVVRQTSFYLQGASSYFFYDLFAWIKSEKRNPVSVVSLVRDNFYRASGVVSTFSCQQTVAYIDGFGRTLETKQKVESGLGYARNAQGVLIKDSSNKPILSSSSDRWLVSGKIIYNNKGNHAEEYLPYHAIGVAYEDQKDLVIAGALPPPKITQYDPLSRAICVLSPKGFFSKIEFTPWEEFHYDENDTIKDSEYYLAKYPNGLTAEELDAVNKALTCYNTPTQKINDNLGRTIRTVENNLGEVFPETFSTLATTTLTAPVIWEELILKNYLALSTNSDGAWPTENFQPYKTDFVFNLDARFDTIKSGILDILRQSRLTSCYQYDIEGRQTCSIDARLFYTNVVSDTTHYNFKNTYSLNAKQPFLVDSVDGGAEFHFTNIFGSLIWSFTARDFNQTIQYDRFQRRTQLRVVGYKDDGTVGSDSVAEQFTYGESQANGSLNNLRGQIYQIKDLSGIVIHSRYDLNGKVVNTSRQFASDYKNTITWATTVPLNTTTFSKSLTYDALGRLLTETNPDGTIIRNTYSQRGLLRTITAKHLTRTSTQTIISSIEYDANNNRTRIVYGNSSQTTYAYEASTLHLTQMRTTRSTVGVSPIVQDIRYTYDPVGNLTRLADSAIQAVFNNNQIVEPISNYTYDPLYRLVQASGRQHPGVAINSHLNNRNSDFKQSKFIASVNDSTRLENYTERYNYDEGGNLIKTAHQASNAWTRETNIQNNSNRILQVVDKTSSSITTPFTYDRSGNQEQLTLNNTIALTWSCYENLTKAAIIVRPDELDDADYYTYDSSEMRTRKISESMSNLGVVMEAEEKYYCDNYEEKIFKTVSATTSTITLRRQTTRIMDGSACVAVFHYWVTDTTRKEVDANGTLKTRFQYGNHLGSVALELDETGQLVSYEEYFPYGGTAYMLGRNQREVAMKEYRYSNKERDDSTGLYYYGARYYAPWLGRWLSADPAGSVDGMNLYAFVGGNPIGYVDLWGMVKGKAGQAANIYGKEKQILGLSRKTKKTVLQKHLDVVQQAYDYLSQQKINDDKARGIITHAFEKRVSRVTAKSRVSYLSRFRRLVDKLSVDIAQHSLPPAQGPAVPSTVVSADSGLLSGATKYHEYSKVVNFQSLNVDDRDSTNEAMADAHEDAVGSNLPAAAYSGRDDKADGSGGLGEAWCHLVAHCLGGEESSFNLVAGSQGANLVQLGPELAIRDFVKKHNDVSVVVRTGAFLYLRTDGQVTHMAESFIYNIDDTAGNNIYTLTIPTTIKKADSLQKQERHAAYGAMAKAFGKPTKHAA